jgi:hypothetical protein
VLSEEQEEQEEEEQEEVVVLQAVECSTFYQERSFGNPVGLLLGNSLCFPAMFPVVSPRHCCSIMRR